MENLNDDIIKKFWNHVDKFDECWIWKGKLNSKSKYGLFRFRIKDKRYEFLAHRISMFLIGKCSERIYHYCKNTKCVNPLHLQPYTHNPQPIQNKQE